MMTVPTKDQLPLSAPRQDIEVDAELVQKFRRSFQSSRQSPPLTLGAVALQGVFALLKSMNVDWRGLLHATQKFEYTRPIHLGAKLSATTQLIDCRLRAGMYWLNFKTDLMDKSSQDIVVSSRSLIMVKESSES